MEVCKTCGQLKGIREYDRELWDIYNRISDGRSTWEALVFTSDGTEDDDDHDSMMIAMGRDMVRRGLCGDCGRPNLRNVTPDQILSRKNLREMQDMWAEEAAERRAGC